MTTGLYYPYNPISVGDVVQYLYPIDVQVGNIVIVDYGDGNGPQILYWNVAGVPQPTIESLLEYADDPGYQLYIAENNRNSAPDGFGNANNVIYKLYQDMVNGTNNFTAYMGDICYQKYPLVSPETAPVLSRLAMMSDIPDLSSYAHTSDLPVMTDYALVSQLPDLSSYAHLSDIPSLSNYALKTDIPINSADNNHVVIASNSGTQTISTTNSQVSLTFDTEVIDASNCFAIDTYTAPEDGIYQVEVFTKCTNFAILSLISAYEWDLYAVQAGSVSQSVLMDVYSHGLLAATNSALNGAVMLKLAVNDTVKIQVKKGNSNNLSCLNSYLSIKKVSEL